MRSFILVTLSALGLAGLFVVCWTIQPAGRVQTNAVQRTNPAPKPADTDPTQLNGIRPGEGVYLSQYDGKGQLTSRFRADRYVPRQDGTIDVINPVARFFLANHQSLDIVGRTGNVMVKDAPNPGRTGFANTGTPAPPSRGRLDDVVVTLTDDLKKVPLITMKTNNVVFDNETFRISTEGFGNIHDDEVPVHVTGQIKIEGRGLTVRWNDTDGRLELLEIAHGDFLEITDPSSFSLSGSKVAPGKSSGGSSRAGEAMPVMLAANDKSAAAQILTHVPPHTRPAAGAEVRTGRASGPPPIYQASFYDNVRINQPDATGSGDQILIQNVSRMDADFLLKQSNPEPATNPSNSSPIAPATRDAAADASISDAAPSENVSGRPAASRPATEPATQPARENEPPIFVHWTGPLRITPVKTPPPLPMKPGDSLVLLTGEPISIHRAEPKHQGSEDVRCATVLYETTGDKVWLGKSDAFPQIYVTKLPAASAKQQDPTRLVSSGAVEYSKADQRARMTGPGSADIPLEPEVKELHPTLHADWTQLAQFDFTQPVASRQPAVRHGHLEGGVNIRHPRLSLRSKSLDLLFDPATAAPPGAQKGSEPNLRQIVATDNVYCEIDGSGAKKQKLEANRLALDTDKSNGKLFARHVNATGSVHAFGEDDLRAQYVDLLLKPSDKSKAKPGDDTAQVELEKLVARDGVVATSKDGSVAAGDELTVTTTPDGRQQTVLTGAAQATVTDVKGNIVRGPEIHFDSSDGKARITGAGSLHAIQQASATQPAQPVDVTWVNSATFDGAANRIDVDGGVAAKLVDKKGFVDTVTGDHLRIDLRPKPTTQPAATQPAGGSALAQVSPKDAGLKMDPFKGKEVVALNVEKNAALTSTLAGPNNDILQQFELEGPTIALRELADDGTPSRTLHVPAAGRMVARDHRPAARQQANASNDSAGARGATAFQWSKELVYSEASRRADIVGDVLVAHQDEDAGQSPVRMSCQHVIAWFEPAPKQPKENAKPGDEPAAMQLHHLTAEGGTVTVTRDADQMTARQVDYDPARHLLIAVGTEQNPVRFTTAGSGTGAAERVEWDTVTWKMKTTNAIFDSRPPTPGIQSGTSKKKPATRSTQ